jgi:transposase
MTGADRGDEVIITVRKTTTRRPAIALEVKTLFNAVQPLRGFICQDAALVRDGQAQRIDIQLREDKRSKPVCGCCGKTAPGYDRQPERRWLFIRLWGIQVELIYRPRRVNCPHCGVRVEDMPWNEGKHLASKALMIYLAQWARRMSWKETATVFKVSWEMVYRSVAWIVTWGLAHRDLSGIEAIGVDELHHGRGKKSTNFITLIYQIDAGRRRLLWVGQRRTEACLRQGIGELAEALRSVKYVCSDMWRPYLKVIAKLLPQALNILDKFHIIAHLNGAVDAVRRAEVSRLGGSKSKGSAGQKLKKMRWSLLRAGKRVRGKARARLNALIQAKGATARAWMLKESFGHFWSYRSVTWAMNYLDAWVTRALKSRLEPMRKVARMLRAHRELLSNYFEARKLYSSGVVEGLNLKCNLIKRRAYGLRSFGALQTALYHNLGALPEPEITHRFC